MSITVNRSKDIEDVVRGILSDYMTAYCVPLPADLVVPSVSVKHTGGSTIQTITGKGVVDVFTVVLDARAESEAEASEYIRNAVAILETVGCGDEISHTALNSLYSWGVDPVRPDLAMCSVTLMITAHRDTVTLNSMED